MLTLMVVGGIAGWLVIGWAVRDIVRARRRAKILRSLQSFDELLKIL